MSDDHALAALAASSFSLPHLRDGQLAGMAALAGGRDVLAVMPTGYGKSAIYQVAALHLKNTTGRPAVVVSPLIALQEDQLDGLSAELGDGAAVAINSSHSDSELEAAWHAAETGKAAFLFLAPEQLAKQETVDRIGKLVAEMGVADPALLDEGIFRDNGGAKRLNAVFGGNLVSLLGDINEEVWKPAA